MSECLDLSPGSTLNYRYLLMKAVGLAYMICCVLTLRELVWIEFPAPSFVQMWTISVPWEGELTEGHSARLPLSLTSAFQTNML